MYETFAILIFVLGLVLGSFLNVLILRIDNLGSVALDRSHCPNCQHVLSWRDLVPVLSFVLLRGRCRYCQKSISWQYPLVEMGTALMLTLFFLIYGFSAGFVFYSVILLLLIVVFVSDIKTLTVPEEFVWAALVVAVLGSWYFGGFGLSRMLLGGLVGGGLLALLVVVSREQWMGSGDVKIGLILGVALGYPLAVIGIFLSFLIGSVVGLTFISLQTKTMKDALPFAPFLIIGLYVTLLFGQSILLWYQRLYLPF
ncbi:MAG: prepilin peptidase [Patescibacteria group bacterium]|jgi:leader peptidase (prepilin peptidase)/N-methyltransferase